MAPIVPAAMQQESSRSSLDAPWALVGIRVVKKA